MAGVGLHRLLTQQVLRQGKHSEQLTVEVIAVGDDHDGRVLHRRFLHDARGKAGHGDALSAALRVPDDAALVRSTRARCRDDLNDGKPHRMELVVASNLLDDAAIIFKQHEVAQVVQQVRWGQNAPDQGF